MLLAQTGGSPVSPQVSRKNLVDVFRTLDSIGAIDNDPRKGFARIKFTETETRMHLAVAEIAKGWGYIVSEDPVRNSFFTIQGSKYPELVIQFGSHLDSVFRGGRWDGPAGVIAGLEAGRAVAKAYGGRPPITIQVVAWRGEEGGPDNSVYTGSRAAFGCLPAEHLGFTYDGKTLETRMRSQGIRRQVIAEIRSGKSFFSSDDIRKVVAHIEAHIEQGPFLRANNMPLGIVSSIRGNQRSYFVVRGQSAHSGGTPMDEEFRQDANLASADMMLQINKLARRFLDRGEDLTATCGVINTDEKRRVALADEMKALMISAVAGICFFSLDVRSNNPKTIRRFRDEVHTLVRKIAGEWGVRVSREIVASATPIPELDLRVVHALGNATRLAGVSAEADIASGAGHDAAVVSEQLGQGGRPNRTAMLFMRNGPKPSHSPGESMTFKDLKAGAEVLAYAVPAIVGEIEAGRWKAPHPGRKG